MVILGHLLYGSILMSASLLVTNFEAKLWMYPLGLGIGHLLIFFPGLLELIRDNNRKSVIIFFLGFQLILSAQDLYVLRLYGDPLGFGGSLASAESEKRELMLTVFYYAYTACEGLGTSLLLSSIYWIQFFDPSHIEKATMLKSMMVFGLALGIAGSVLYSLAWELWIHYMGCGLIGTATLVYGFGFIAGRFNWLRPPRERRPVLVSNRRITKKIEREPLMKRIVPIRVPQKGPRVPVSP